MKKISNEALIIEYRRNNPLDLRSNEQLGQLFWHEAKQFEGSQRLGLVLSRSKGVGGLPKSSTLMQMEDDAFNHIWEIVENGLAPKPTYEKTLKLSDKHILSFFGADAEAYGIVDGVNCRFQVILDDRIVGEFIKKPMSGCEVVIPKGIRDQIGGSQFKLRIVRL